MATQESTLVDTQFQSDWQNNNIEPPTTLQVVSSSPYMHDLKKTLEFDRACRSLESLFNDLNARVEALQQQLRPKALPLESGKGS